MTNDRFIMPEVQQDWSNREYIEIMAEGIQKIAEFLVSFDLSCRSRLSLINEKISYLEKKMDYLESDLQTTHKEYNCDNI